jgi:uncharacterized protein YpiB (UPF0302 family)
MLSSNKTILKIGDWIKGKSRDGELIIGYIESLDILEDKVNVTVTTSDNEAIVGVTIPMLTKQVKKLPDAQVKNKEQIQFLIDLALTTGDENWFMELSSKLNSMRELVNSVK